MDLTVTPTDPRNMSSERRFFVGGNWKMNGSKASIQELVKVLNAAGETASGRIDLLLQVFPEGARPSLFMYGSRLKLELFPLVEIIVAPPAVYVDLVRSTLRPDFGVAVQNIYKVASGAFTGETR